MKVTIEGYVNLRPRDVAALRAWRHDIMTEIVRCDLKFGPGTEARDYFRHIFDSSSAEDTRREYMRITGASAVSARDYVARYFQGTK